MGNSRQTGSSAKPLDSEFFSFVQSCHFAVFFLDVEESLSCKLSLHAVMLVFQSTCFLFHIMYMTSVSSLTHIHIKDIGKDKRISILSINNGRHNTNCLNRLQQEPNAVKVIFLVLSKPHV